VVRGLPTALDDLVARATRRDPGARPTDAGALLAEVQVVRDDLGAANVETALLRQVQSRHGADATAMIPALATSHPMPGDRPTWARLPEQQPRAYGQRRPAPGPAGLLDRVHSFFTGGDRRRVTILAAVLVMALVVIGSTWWVTIGRYTDTPQLVNMTKAQAEAAAQQSGFEIFYGDGAYSETVPKDVVLTQNPPTGQRIVHGGLMTLTLSLGPERYAVPDLVGIEFSVAKANLEAVKLKLKQGDKQYSDTIAEGVIISSDPPADEIAKPGDTVTVVVSKGRAPITVPDLTGKNINDARGILQGLGLNAVEQYKDNDQPLDTVIGQSPKAGSGAQKDDEIKLDVSKGPALITVPRVIDVPCDQAQQQLKQLNLQPRVGLLGTGLVRQQDPQEGTQLPPQSEVRIQCF
jgi:beta-lactam-binding protein with PASTA domain